MLRWSRLRSKMRKHFLIYSFICGIILLSGCGQDVRFVHYGAPFTIASEQTLSIQDLDSQYRRFIKTKTPVRVMGLVKYQCHIRGAWAFLEQGERLLLVDFSRTSPNVFLPVRKTSRPLVVEGLVLADDTVLNKYCIVPLAFEYQR